MTNLYKRVLEPKVIKVELLVDSEVIKGMQTYEVTYETGEVNEFLADSCEQAIDFAYRFYFV